MSEIQHAGGYLIQKCKLTSSSGLVYPDFEKVITGINIFENITLNPQYIQWKDENWVKRNVIKENFFGWNFQL